MKLPPMKAPANDTRASELGAIIPTRSRKVGAEEVNGATEGCATGPNDRDDAAMALFDDQILHNHIINVCVVERSPETQHCRTALGEGDFQPGSHMRDGHGTDSLN